MAPEAMVHGRDETNIALFKPPWKRLLGKHKGLDDDNDSDSDNNDNGDENKKRRTKLQPSLGQIIRTQTVHALDGWRAYFRQPILPSSLTFVLLFFNVALSPGGLITAFLAKGLDGTGMAIFRGGCAVMGFTGTWVGRRLIQRHGLLGAGERALFIQLVFLFIATASYGLFLSTPSLLPAAFPASFGLGLFTAAVVLSRVGMWSFDMVNAQLFQQNVSQREVGATSATEMALCSFSELLMLGLAAYVFGPESYNQLIYTSFGAVIGANLLFRWWARTSKIEQSSDEEEESGASGGGVAVAMAA